MKYVSVAVDGPAGSGKSTITKMVAKSLGFNYVDTGAMYRALTFNFLSNGLDELEEEKIKELLSKTDFKVEYVDGVQYVYVNDVEVSDKIRTAEVSKFTSLFAKSPAVRDFLIDTQRNLANTNNIIMDGRDIASTYSTLKSVLLNNSLISSSSNSSNPLDKKLYVKALYIAPVST